MLAKLILERLHPEAVGIGGPVTGADPITGAVITHSWGAGRPLHGFMVRKEAKGTVLETRWRPIRSPRWVEGHHDRGHCHDGWSLLKAINAVEAAGLNVVQVLCVAARSVRRSLRPRVTREDIT